MLIIEKISEMQAISTALKVEGKKVAVVPTMGYFHNGHLNLIRKAKSIADVVITTLFVNPLQFAPNEDFEKYPRNIERDSKLAEEAGSDFLFYPSVSEMYPQNFGTVIAITGVTTKFEGASRPSHFNGVATVVAKLLNATQPNYAIFGQKDFQQTLVIKQLITDLNMNIQMVVAPTTREEDGLAMSSRNVYLSEQERKDATIIFKALGEAIAVVQNGERKRKVINAVMHKELRSVPYIRIDYASAADSEYLFEPDEFLPSQQIVLLIAAYLGKTRLIDNALVTVPS
ncbi:MAG TPA: pantoate--beta-alanine ligase [Candidatus Kapabacteria bacterium]|nr:pantoate--beta-alanine ligase [Candidatus Kapabacteria bacterium]HPO63540.1 pantoate--beta-alanine ligase [Candidatus Kapabacteria bacterium]